MYLSIYQTFELDHKNPFINPVLGLIVRPVAAYCFSFAQMFSEVDPNLCEKTLSKAC